MTVRPRWVTHHTSVTGGETLTHWVASTCFALGGTAACVASAASSIRALCGGARSCLFDTHREKQVPPKYLANAYE